MHGNNKSAAELAAAVEAGVGRIVVDSFDELDRLDELHAATGARPHVQLRITPGVEAHTHEYVTTGVDDTKFGFTASTGLADAAIRRAREADSVELVGLHAHIGSQVFELRSFQRAVEVIAGFAQPYGLPELSLGGGLGVAYVEGETAPTIAEWAAAIGEACASAGFTAPVSVEPGRALVAAAAITLYEVGTIKELPGIRTYVSVDGGMSDNPARCSTTAAMRPSFPGPLTATATRQCELWASTASRATSWCETAGCPAISRWVTSWPPRSPALRPLHGLQLQQGPPPRCRVCPRRRRPPSRPPRDLRGPPPQRRLALLVSGCVSGFTIAGDLDDGGLAVLDEVAAAGE